AATGTAHAWPRPTPTPTPVRYDTAEVLAILEITDWRYEVNGDNVTVTATYRNHSNLCAVSPEAAIKAEYGPDGDSAYVEHPAVLTPAAISAYQTGTLRAEVAWPDWRLGRNAFGYIYYQGWRPCDATPLRIAPLPPGTPIAPVTP
ncbi:MAG: hypothetical protein ACE5HE_08870, partial [Phycisphaerae bacterium]